MTPDPPRTPDRDLLPLFPEHSSVAPDGELAIGGVGVSDLAERPQSVLIRIIPGVAPQTHESQSTGGGLGVRYTLGGHLGALLCYPGRNTHLVAR